MKPSRDVVQIDCDESLVQLNFGPRQRRSIAWPRGCALKTTPVKLFLTVTVAIEEADVVDSHVADPAVSPDALKNHLVRLVDRSPVGELHRTACHEPPVTLNGMPQIGMASPKVTRDSTKASRGRFGHFEDAGLDQYCEQDV